MIKSIVAAIACFSIILYSCKEDKKINIIGLYKMDKFIENVENGVLDYKYLRLNTDNTFELKHQKEDPSNIINGSWKIINENSEEILIKFDYKDKQVKGILKETIFYFDSINDFHNSKYNSLLYVKLKE